MSLNSELEHLRNLMANGKHISAIWEERDEAFEALRSVFMAMSVQDVMMLVLKYFDLYLPYFNLHFTHKEAVHEAIVDVRNAIELFPNDTVELIDFDYHKHFKSNSPVYRGFVDRSLRGLRTMYKAIYSPKHFAEFAQETITSIFAILIHQFETDVGLPQELKVFYNGNDYKEFKQYIWSQLLFELDEIADTVYLTDDNLTENPANN